MVIALLTLVGTGVAHAMQSADPTELRPDNTAAHGGSTLAGDLRAAGVAVREMTKSSDALVAAYQGNVTLFVPAPGLMNPAYLRMLKLLPSSTRVVLVEPSAYTLSNGLIPVLGTGTRWATAPVDPGCPMPEARQAGQAAVYRNYYEPTTGTQLRCYRDALVDAPVGPAQVLLVGSSDPFRNDRIGELHNATLATGLLSRYPTVVWLDLQHSEPPPGVVNQSPDQNLPAAPPSLGNGGSPDPDFTLPAGPGGGQGGGQGGTGQGASGSRPPPLPIPPQFWAVVAMLAAAALALALARARRLGPPVGEPLPVLVRGVETVTGRGRLYRRARARSTALGALRTAALYRLLPVLDLPDDQPPPSTVVDALARRTGWDADRVDAVLYGTPPDNDHELVRAARDLDALLHDALTDVREGESG
jgi:hypothetical protein